MKLVGDLSEYSLPEIFSFLDKCSQTGALIVSTDNNNSTSPINQYLWFKEGRIVAVTNGIDGTELLTKILQRKLISQIETQAIGKNIDHLSEPLGLYLKSQGLIEVAQLKLLFNLQTIFPVVKLFEPDRIRFKFEAKRVATNAELTGLSITATELGFLGLRLLKNWSGLIPKLADPSYSIQKCHSHQPNFELSRQELQLWKLADGKTTLTQLAVKMSISNGSLLVTTIEEILQISFRLSTFRFVREISTKSIRSIDSDLALPSLAPDSSNSPVSISFLGGLKKFLKQRLTNNI